MLPFHEHIAAELFEQDGLTVLAAGLGLNKAVAALLELRYVEGGLIFLLSTSDQQRQALCAELRERGSPFSVQEVSAAFSSSERSSLYGTGGVLAVTSRILIVDLLNDRVPLTQVTGIVLNNAHRVTDTCTEAFILRIYRASNRTGFTAAFSDRPQSLSMGFSKVERVLKALFLRRLYLWPRFQAGNTINISTP